MIPKSTQNFEQYLTSFIKPKEIPEEGVELPLDDIPNRNPHQVPDILWHELIINHIVYGHYN